MINITLYLTVGICALIVAALLFFMARPDERTVAGAPSMLTSFGVFGTFLGIAIGLTRFNQQEIVSSVPIFLGGIKLAFWSSVVGIMAAIIHRMRFLVWPLPSEGIPDNELDSRVLDSLDKMTRSLESLNDLAKSRDPENRDLQDAVQNIIAMGDRVETGLKSMSGELTNGFGSLAIGVSEQARQLTQDVKTDEAVVALLAEIKEELIKDSHSRKTLLNGLNELGRERDSAGTHIKALGEDLIVLTGKVERSLKAMLGELTNGFGNLAIGVSEQARMLTDELKTDNRVLEALTGLKAELVKSRDGQFDVREQMKGLLDLYQNDLFEKAQLQSQAFLAAFAELQKKIASNTEINREISRKEMEEFLAGFNTAAGKTLGRLSGIAEETLGQTTSQGKQIADEISEASEASTRAMLGMLTKILAATEDSHRRVVNELKKLREDVSSDMRVHIDQSKALAEQLQAMTESYKASLIATTTDLKAQISKDMKSSYSLIDSYTRNVADVTGSNQLEALERLEAIANIMQNVVESSTDMSKLLHDNAVAMSDMRDALTGTHEGSLGRFLLNMNEKVIDQLRSLENAFAAQGSLGLLMEELNSEILKHFKALEKLSEFSMQETRQLPKEIAKGLVELKGNGGGSLFQ